MATGYTHLQCHGSGYGHDITGRTDFQPSSDRQYVMFPCFWTSFIVLRARFFALDVRERFAECIWQMFCLITP